MPIPTPMMRVVLWVVTLLWIALIPVALSVALTAQQVARTGEPYGTMRWTAIGIFFVMGMSDILDGWIARRFDLMTQIGATVDAVADKLVQVVLVAFFTLSVGPVFTPLPLWFLNVVFGRDLVGVLVLRVQYGPLRVVHRSHGRVASMLMLAVLVWCAFGLPVWGLLPLTLVTAAVSVWSATRYALDGAAQGRAIAAG